MSVSEYFEAIKTHLLSEPLVENFQIVKERKADSDGHIRVGAQWKQKEDNSGRRT